MTIQQLQAEYDQALADFQSTVARGLDQTTQKAAAKKAVDLKARLANAQGDANCQAEIDRITGDMTSSARGGGRGRGSSSLGQQFIASEVGQYLFNHRGRFPTGAWTSPSVELIATTLDEGSSGGDLVVPDFRPGIVPTATRRLVMADLIAPGTTESNQVKYIRETTFTNAAAPVREGDPKPQSTLAFEETSDDVVKIPHWLPVTTEMLEDVPTIRSFIDARLRLGVQLAEDDQLLNGNGTAPNMTGLLQRSNLAPSLARTGTMTNADIILDQICAIELATNLPVDGIVMNPTNWGTILKSKDGNGQYYGGGPLGSPVNPILWGRVVSVTPAIVANTALVGCYRTASQLFRKGGVRVEASNSHADFFIRNLIAIRCEERIALAVYRPAAFGTVTALQ